MPIWRRMSWIRYTGLVCLGDGHADIHDERVFIRDQWYRFLWINAAVFRLARYHGRHRGHKCLRSGHEMVLPAKLLRRLTHPGPIGRTWAIIRRACHHAYQLVGRLCMPCLDIHADMAPDVMEPVHWPSLSTWWACWHTRRESVHTRPVVPLLVIQRSSFSASPISWPPQGRQMPSQWPWNCPSRQTAATAHTSRSH